MVSDAEERRKLIELEKEAKKQKTIIYDDNRWMVVSPHSHKASCYYGAGTKWCVTAKNTSNHWDRYSRRATFFYIIDKTKKQIYFSSANRKIVLVKSKKEVKIISGSRYPIGGWQLNSNRTFDSKIISYEEGDHIYLGSDGYQDQIGGSKNKKFKSKNLHQMFSEIHQNDITNKKDILLDTFYQWKGNNEQTDDVCLIGITL